MPVPSRGQRSGGGGSMPVGVKVMYLSKSVAILDASKFGPVMNF